MVAEALALTCARPSGEVTIGPGGPWPRPSACPPSNASGRSTICPPTPAQLPSFAERVEDIVALFTCTRRPMPSSFRSRLLIKRGKCVTVTHDCKRPPMPAIEDKLTIDPPPLATSQRTSWASRHRRRDQHDGREDRGFDAPPDQRIEGAKPDH